MEFFLTDEAIERLPPADTRLLELRAEPYPDGKRLRVALDLTPFQQKPYLELTLTNSAGEVVPQPASLSRSPGGSNLPCTLANSQQPPVEYIGSQFTYLPPIWGKLIAVTLLVKSHPQGLEC